MKQKIHLPFALFIAFAILLTACDKDVACDNGFVERKEYYADGTVKSITTYRDSVKDGKYISFYVNGKIREEGQYKDGKKDGAWKEWSKNGSLLTEQNCKALEDETCFVKSWYGKGRLEGKYKGGLREGVWRRWHENGQIKEVEFYKGGKLFAHKYFDENGNLLEEKESSGGWEERCRTVMVHDRRTLQNHCDAYFIGDGFEKKWYGNGQLRSEEYYKESKRDGVWKSCY